MSTNGFSKKLEDKLLPVASKISSNIYLTSIRDGFATIMPLLICGSLFMVISNFPIDAWIKWLRATEINGNSLASYFNAASDATFSIMSIFAVLGIGYSYASKLKLNAIFGGIVAMMAWFLLMPFSFEFTPEGADKALKVTGLTLDWLGSKGIFIGMICAFSAVKLYKWAIDRGWVIKMPDGVPPTVGVSFASLLPIGFCMIIFVVIRFLFTLTPYGNAFNFVYSILQMPLQHIGGTLPAIIIVYLFAHILWFLGIHGTNITDSVFMPILYALSAQNLQNVQNGVAPTNIINVQFQNLFATFGGAGSTLSLLIVAVIVAKSARMKQTSRLSILPAVFNINEPVIYGLPIVLNPLLMAPFILVPTMNIIITYITMSIGLVPITNGALMPWTTPPIVSGFLSCGWQGAVLQFVLIGLGCLVYYPFVKALDDNYRKTELEVKETK